MEDNSKLFVFDKKEVALIFLFMTVISVMSFTFGFHLGKKASFDNSGLTAADKQKISLQSDQEEDVAGALEKLKSEATSAPTEAIEGTDTQDKLKENSLGQLKNEFEMLDKEMGSKGATASANGKTLVGPEVTEKLPDEVPQSSLSNTPTTETVDFKEVVQDSQKYIGKFTIQLGSHPTLKEAKEFADAFTIRGYNPIINQVTISGRGTWYRVGLGLFASMNEAKDYIKKEEALFHGQEYVIVEIK